MAEVVSPVVLRPEILFLSDVKQSNAIEKKIMAWSIDGDPFRITRIDTVGTGLKAEYSQNNANMVKITFHSRIENINKLINQTINIFVALSDNNDLHLELPIYTSIKTD